MESFIAILILCGLLAIGEIFSSALHYKVSGYILAMIAIVILGGQFGLITTEHFEHLEMVDLTYNYGLAFLLMCFGASISFREFRSEWKTAVMAITTVAIVVAIGFILGFTIFDKQTMVYGTISVAGGTQAAMIFISKLKEVGGDPLLPALILFILNMQVLVGYPVLTAFLRRGMKKRLASGVEIIASEKKEIQEKTLIKLPACCDNFYFTFAILAITGIIGKSLENLTGLNAFVWYLVFGTILRFLGLLNGNSLNKIGAEGFLNKALYIVLLMDIVAIDIPALLIILPKMFGLFAIGVIGSLLAALLLVRFFKDMSFADIMAINIACMVGYPMTLMACDESIKAISHEMEIAEEVKQRLSAFYKPKIVISGIISVSVVSGIVAGIVVGFV